ncbi:hypothetical protein TruAng_007104 [Truncatella angustata]|nr:hypothetical protein TruAng_007104 [Truncatella angustata]
MTSTSAELTEHPNKASKSDIGSRFEEDQIGGVKDASTRITFACSSVLPKDGIGLEPAVHMDHSVSNDWFQPGVSGTPNIPAELSNSHEHCDIINSANSEKKHAEKYSSNINGFPHGIEYQIWAYPSNIGSSSACEHTDDKACAKRHDNEQKSAVHTAEDESAQPEPLCKSTSSNTQEILEDKHPSSTAPCTRARLSDYGRNGERLDAETKRNPAQLILSELGLNTGVCRYSDSPVTSVHGLEASLVPALQTATTGLLLQNPITSQHGATPRTDAWPPNHYENSAHNYSQSSGNIPPPGNEEFPSMQGFMLDGATVLDAANDPWSVYSMGALAKNRKCTISAVIAAVPCARSVGPGGTRRW